MAWWCFWINLWVISIECGRIHFTISYGIFFSVADRSNSGLRAPPSGHKEDCTYLGNGRNHFDQKSHSNKLWTTCWRILYSNMHVTFKMLPYNLVGPPSLFNTQGTNRRHSCKPHKTSSHRVHTQTCKITTHITFLKHNHHAENWAVKMEEF